MLKNLPKDGFSDYLSKMSEDKKSDYFSTCREIVVLNDENYTYGGVQSFLTEEGTNPVIQRLPLEIGTPTDLAEQIYTLAELSEIPEEDMQETFQYWE